jgi:hypothetical protein
MEINPREERGKLIIKKEGQLFHVSEGLYRVRSQSANRFYDIRDP